MPTTFKECKDALKAQIASVEAGSRPDAEKKKIVARIRRIYGDLLGPAATKNDEDQMQKHAWRDVKAMQSDAAYFDEQLFQQEMVSLLQKFGALPDDDADPKVLDKAKLKRLLRKMTSTTDTPHVSERTQKFAAEKLAQFFDTKVDLPGDEVDLSAELGMLNGGEVPVESVLYELARKVAADGAKLRPKA